MSGPANSPENWFSDPAGGQARLAMGPSMDQEIYWDLFTNVLDAAAALGIEDAFTRQVRRPGSGCWCLASARTGG